MEARALWAHPPAMLCPRHHLRAWRLHRGLTLEQVAERVSELGSLRNDTHADALTAPVTMTHASLSRIERGLQPYSQVLLEILAAVYMTDAASLLVRDPTDPDGIWSIWDRITPAQREVALTMLRGLTRAA